LGKATIPVGSEALEVGIETLETGSETLEAGSAAGEGGAENNEEVHAPLHASKEAEERLLVTSTETPRAVRHYF
jgi:hypothetical protein